jgi:TRAP-type C4-dicarboxylate transport system substrate-binding protein
MEYAARPWMRAIEEATDGRVEFEEYYSQTLSKGLEAWQATAAGIADVSWIALMYYPNMSSLDAMILPFIPFKNPAQSAGIAWTLYEEFPSIREQLNENKVLFLYGSAPFFVINNKREIKSLEDFKGLKLRWAGGPCTEQARLLGFSTMVTAMPDSYLNIQKGVIDGMAVTWDILAGFKQYEVAKYFTYAPMYSVHFAYVMNWDVWNNLPPDIQEVFNTYGGMNTSMFFGTHFFEGYDSDVTLRNEIWLKKIKEEGHEIVEYYGAGERTR